MRTRCWCLMSHPSRDQDAKSCGDHDAALHGNANWQKGRKKRLVSSPSIPSPLHSFIHLHLHRPTRTHPTTLATFKSCPSTASASVTRMVVIRHETEARTGPQSERRITVCARKGLGS